MSNSFGDLTYEELLQKRAELDETINQRARAEKRGAIEKALELINRYKLEIVDLFPRGSGRPGAPAPKRVAPKYRDPVTGATWTGRGKAPLWIADKDRSQFLLEKSQASKDDTGTKPS